jgi:hypothetical protein
LIAGPWILGEIADCASSNNLTTGWHAFASEYFAERGFSGAISPNKSDSITVVNADGDIFY